MNLSITQLINMAFCDIGSFGVQHHFSLFEISTTALGC